MKKVHLHLVSDATGDTARSVARACLVQFDDVEFTEHFWVLVRTQEQMERAIDGIASQPGIVVCTVLDETLRNTLEQASRRMNVPFIPVLDQLLGALGAIVGTPSRRTPGRQHAMDASYFDRIDAMQYMTAHDDGQSTWSLDQADVVLVGVSRTSKTPTCVYLANRGLRSANVPYVPNVPLPRELFSLRRTLVVGLTLDPMRLVQIRRNRLLALNQEETSYVEIDLVKAEIAEARRVFLSHRWPIIDVTRRSIEETATAIIQLIADRQEEIVRT